MDENKGGVQRVSKVLGNEFERRSNSVYYLSLAQNDTVDESSSPQIYMPIVSKEAVSRLFTAHNFHIIINQAGPHVKALEFIKIASEVSNPKIYSVLHNCVSCLVDNYEQIYSAGGGALAKALSKVNSSFLWSFMKLYYRWKHHHIFRKVLMYSDKLVFLSPGFIHEFKQVYFLKGSDDKLKSIPNPLSFEPLSLSCLEVKDKRIVYVGRVEYGQKRTDRVIEVWRSIHQEFPEWELDVIGDGPLLESLKDHVKKSEVPRINFHGYKDPRPFLEKAKVLMMTSSFEGFGMVLAEAKAYGVVPIAFNCYDGINRIIDDPTSGRLIKQDDLDSYSNNLKRLLGNESNLNAMAENGLKAIQKFHVRKVANEWERLFNKL